MIIYIFECSDLTEGECFERGLFGTPARWPLGRVHKGDLCFLFNYQGTRRLIYGVYEALGEAQRNIVPEAWRTVAPNGFPNQVRVKLCSRERIGVPRANIDRLVTNPDDGYVRNWVSGPVAQELLDYFAGGYTQEREAGRQMDVFEDDFRRKYPREFHCSDGHDVRSLSEQSIDEWLSKHIVYHEYERLANVPEHLVPDFTVYSRNKRPVFMEFWGMLDNPDYQQRRLRKCDVYHRHRCTLIELYPDDLQNLDFVLRQKLGENGVDFD